MLTLLPLHRREPNDRPRTPCGCARTEPDNDCFYHSQFHFGTIFFLLFLYNIKEILQPIIKSKLKKASQSSA